MNSPHKGQWHGDLMFPLICVWTNGWVNNRYAGYLRRHRAHYGVPVMRTGYQVQESKSHCLFLNLVSDINTLPAGYQYFVCWLAWRKINWCNNLELYPFVHTAYPKKYAHGFCFAVLCCGYTLTDFLISIRLTSLALWQSNDCPSASKATLMNMDKYFMWIHYERLHNHNKAKHNKTVCIFLGIYCKTCSLWHLLLHNLLN